MVILTNPALMSAIRNSYALQQRLNSHEINILIEKSFELGQEAQEELLQKLKQEQAEIENLQHSEQHKQKLEKYQLDINKYIIHAKKQAEKDAELVHQKNIENIDLLLKNL